MLLILGCGPASIAVEPTDDTAGTPDDRDGDGVTNTADCAPDNPTVSAAAHEICDGIDNDCDGAVDEGYDLDSDGYRVDDPGCNALGGAPDCDDDDAAVHPGAMEECNDRDDDCSGTVDDGPDGDGDGYTHCVDCDDADDTRHPGAEEACDGVDNDCSGAADEPHDDDGDGVSECGGDCNDADPLLAPNQAERCDGQDNDCDGDTDEGYDADRDGYTTCRGDCDDASAATHPGNPEICDGLENDCDPNTVDDADLDGDGYTLCGGDCNDVAADANPDGVEVCDGLDNDCDGTLDALPECYDCTASGDYVVCTQLVTWPTAEEACEAFGATLAVIGSAAENVVVGDLIYNATGNAGWIGFNDRSNEGRWVWPTGEAVAYTNWYSGEPNDSGGEDCAATNFGAMYAWNDYPCTGTSLPFACEQ